MNIEQFIECLPHSSIYSWCGTKTRWSRVSWHAPWIHPILVHHMPKFLAFHHISDLLYYYQIECQYLLFRVTISSLVHLSFVHQVCGHVCGATSITQEVILTQFPGKKEMMWLVIRVCEWPVILNSFCIHMSS